MTATLHLQPTQVATGYDEDGLLVFDKDQRLVAVLVRLGALHETPGQWFLEVGFGRVEDVAHPTFETLDEARDWIEARLGATMALSH